VAEYKTSKLAFAGSFLPENVFDDDTSTFYYTDYSDSSDTYDYLQVKFASIMTIMGLTITSTYSGADSSDFLEVNKWQRSTISYIFPLTIQKTVAKMANLMITLIINILLKRFLTKPMPFKKESK